jgi:hypothetical protein
LRRCGWNKQARCKDQNQRSRIEPERPSTASVQLSEPGAKNIGHCLDPSHGSEDKHPAGTVSRKPYNWEASLARSLHCAYTLLAANPAFEFAVEQIGPGQKSFLRGKKNNCLFALAQRGFPLDRSKYIDCGIASGAIVPGRGLISNPASFPSPLAVLATKKSGDIERSRFLSPKSSWMCRSSSDSCLFFPGTGGG